MGDATTCDHPPSRPRAAARPLSRREARWHSALTREARRHADAGTRADLVLDIDDEIDRRGMLRVDAHAACGLAPGALDDCSLTTDALRAALATLRGLPS